MFQFYILLIVFFTKFIAARIFLRLCAETRYLMAASYRLCTNSFSVIITNFSFVDYQGLIHTFFSTVIFYKLNPSKMLPKVL